MVHDAQGASQNVDLDDYYWWNEGLKGIGGGPQSPEYGARFRSPTEYATMFPQPINLASSFNKDLFLAVGNATGNEARLPLRSIYSGANSNYLIAAYLFPAILYALFNILEPSSTSETAD